MEPPDYRYLQNHRIFQARARRRLADPALNSWLETAERLRRCPVRTDEERDAQHEALMLLEQARPGAARSHDHGVG